MGDFSPPNWEETLGNLRGSWTQSYASWSVWGVLNRQRNSRPILDHHSPMELYPLSWGFRFGNVRLPRDRSEFGNESSNLEFADRRLKNQAICQLKARWIPGWEKALMKGSLFECYEPKKKLLYTGQQGLCWVILFQQNHAETSNRFFSIRPGRLRSVLHGKVVNIVLPVGLVLAAVLLLTYCHATA